MAINWFAFAHEVGLRLHRKPVNMVIVITALICLAGMGMPFLASQIKQCMCRPLRSVSDLFHT